MPLASKAKSNYRAGNEAEHCSICTMFRLPDTCTAVAGKISPSDLCDYFEYLAMPLTAKGEEIKSALEKEYGAKKGEQVLYAGKNKGTFTGIDSDSAAKIDDALLSLRMSIKSLTSATINEVRNETRLLKSALQEALSLDISRANPRFAKRAELIMLANATMARRTQADTLTRLVDSVNNLQQRFDAMCEPNPKVGRM